MGVSDPLPLSRQGPRAASVLQLRRLGHVAADGPGVVGQTDLVEPGVKRQRLHGAVRGVKQGHARGLVDAARLDADVAVLHQVHTTDAMTTAHHVEHADELSGRATLTVNGHRRALLEGDGHLFGLVGRLLDRRRLSMRSS